MPVAVPTSIPTFYNFYWPFQCLGIEVHAGATHKFYHPKWVLFFAFTPNIFIRFTFVDVSSRVQSAKMLSISFITRQLKE